MKSTAELLSVYQRLRVSIETSYSQRTKTGISNKVIALNTLSDKGFNFESQYINQSKYTAMSMESLGSCCRHSHETLVLRSVYAEYNSRENFPICIYSCAHQYNITDIFSYLFSKSKYDTLKEVDTSKHFPEQRVFTTGTSAVTSEIECLIFFPLEASFVLKAPENIAGPLNISSCSALRKIRLISLSLQFFIAKK